MTCIVGLKQDGKVFIGGDSLGSDTAFNCSVRNDPKVARIGEAVIGYTTSFRMGQILFHQLKLPKHPKKMKNFDYMVTKFIPEVIKIFKANGYAKSTVGQPGEIAGGSFLVGYHGDLYTVSSDFQVGDNKCGFDAIGCGAAYAVGSIAADVETNTVLEWGDVQEQLDNKLSPNQILYKALRIAEEFSAGVRAPFIILEVK